MPGDYTCCNTGFVENKSHLIISSSILGKYKPNQGPDFIACIPPAVPSAIP